MELHLRVPIELGEYLRVHATYSRDVAITRLARDILTLWVISKTDLSDPAFRPERLGVPFPSFGSEPHEGYLESLCDAEE